MAIEQSVITPQGEEKTLYFCVEHQEERRIGVKRALFQIYGYLSKSAKDGGSAPFPGSECVVHIQNWKEQIAATEEAEAHEVDHNDYDVYRAKVAAGHDPIRACYESIRTSNDPANARTRELLESGKDV